MKLTVKQRAFVEEYLIDLNSTQAAIRAGYSKNRSSEIGYQLLQKTTVQEYIKKRMKDREIRTEITQDMVLKELAHIAFDDISNYLSYKTVKTVVAHDKETGEPIIGYATVVELTDSDKVDTRSIAEVSVGTNGTFKFKQYSKDNALVNIGKHLGMFKEQIDLNTTVSRKLEDYLE